MGELGENTGIDDAFFDENVLVASQNISHGSLNWQIILLVIWFRRT